MGPNLDEGQGGRSNTISASKIEIPDTIGPSVPARLTHPSWDGDQATGKYWLILLILTPNAVNTARKSNLSQNIPDT